MTKKERIEQEINRTKHLIEISKIGVKIKNSRERDFFLDILEKLCKYCSRKIKNLNFKDENLAAEYGAAQLALKFITEERAAIEQAEEKLPKYTTKLRILELDLRKFD